MIPALILVAGSAALAALKGSHLLRRCPECGSDFASLRACAAHIRRAHTN